MSVVLQIKVKILLGVVFIEVYRFYKLLLVPYMMILIDEPLHEKTNSLGFRPGYKLVILNLSRRILLLCNKTNYCVTKQRR